MERYQPTGLKLGKNYTSASLHSLPNVSDQLSAYNNRLRRYKVEEKGKEVRSPCYQISLLHEIVPNIVLFTSELTKMGGKRNKNYTNGLFNGQILSNDVAW